MGGYGSGRAAGDGRGTTDAARRLDIRWLRRQDYLQPGLRFAVHWRRGDQPSGDIRVIVDEEAEALTLRYRYREGGGEWIDVAQIVPLEWTPCHYGGRRPWLRCQCGRRVAVLYGTGERFTCRRCSRLCYAVELESRDDRLLTRAMRIRRRLGQTEGGIAAPFPPKPPRMHWLTYWRLSRQAAECELQHWEAGYARIAGMRARLDDLKAGLP